VLAGVFMTVQIMGGVIGVWVAHVMFDMSLWQLSTTDRAGVPQWVSEIVATFGLLFVIFGGLRSRPDAVPTLVALYITGAYWFTSSTSFANPAVTIARGFSDTFAGINPAHVPMFIAMQCVGLAISAIALPRLFRD
jgi:glycerol uptake facilitator-like aquaporin